MSMSSDGVDESVGLANRTVMGLLGDRSISFTKFFWSFVTSISFTETMIHPLCMTDAA